MIKSIVYKSNTGHTKQYAEMLSEVLKVPAYDLKEAKSNLKKNDEIVFLGWVCATKIQGLSKIKTEKEDFNTDFHEAVAMVPVDDESMKGKVVDCVQTGYTLNNKVIRHSKVAVGQ